MANEEHSTMQLEMDKAASAPSCDVGAQAIAIIIVNFCTADLTIACLQSLADELRLWPKARVIVADNASPDGSGRMIAGAIITNGWADWAEVLACPRNGGFAYGNNAAIRTCLSAPEPPEYFWLLNSDTIVRPGALAALVAFLNSKPDAGIAGSCLEDPDGTQQYSSFRFHSIASELEAAARLGPLSKVLRHWAVTRPLSRETQKTDWLAGASLLVRAQVFREAGLMDEDYFLYYEETDFCREANACRWQSYFVGESRVVHLVGKSSGIAEGARVPRRRPQYWYQSRRRYFIKNHGWLYAVGADCALAIGSGIARLREIVERRPTAIPEAFFYDLACNSALLNYPGWSRNGNRQSPAEKRN